MIRSCYSFSFLPFIIMFYFYGNLRGLSSCFCNDRDVESLDVAKIGKISCLV